MIKSVFLMFSLICIVQGGKLNKVPDDQGMRVSQMFAVSGEGVITSHESYPEGEYPNNLAWIKNLEVAPGKVFELTFVEDFEIEIEIETLSCRYDWVEIVDGDGRDLVKRTCGTSKPDTVTSTTNKVSVEFKTDESGGFKGFKLQWREVVDPFNCVCGVPNRDSKIIGGVTTEKNEYPWQVGVVTDGPSCGGSIISDMTILTSAYCTRGLSASSIYVVVGDHDWSVAEGSEQRVSVCNIIQHPMYDPNNINNLNGGDYDYSLLILCSPLTFKREVQPVCLPTLSGCIYEYRSATVSGGGTTEFTGQQSQQLMEANVTTITNLDCKKKVFFEFEITDNMICASGTSQEFCTLYRGGPLIANEPGHDHSVLIGVVSWGFGCGSLPLRIYSRVTAQKKFIEDNMTGNICPVPK